MKSKLLADGFWPLFWQFEGSSVHTHKIIRGDQRGGTHTNERSHVKLITISSNGLYDREERSDLNPSTSSLMERHR